jgi:hypothetical protein
MFNFVMDMKTFIYCLCAIFLSILVCSFSAIKKKDIFTVTKSTSQHFSGGARGSAHGTKYAIYAKMNTTATFKLNQVWVGDVMLDPVELVPAKKNETFKKGESISIYGRDVRQAGMGDTQLDSLKVPPPFKYEGAALISVSINNTNKYIIVKSFEILERLNYP